MKLRWLSSALLELDRVHQFIAQENPKAAKQVFTRIRGSTKNLKRFPESGRIGQVPGTRELVVTNLPYIVLYRVSGDVVEILRVFHTSQEPANPFH